MTQLNGLGNHREEELVLLGFLEIMIRLMVDGKLMVNHTLKVMILILDGLDQECLEENKSLGKNFIKIRAR